MRTLFPVFATLLALAGPAAADNQVHLRGVVFDRVTNAGIAGAKVFTLPPTHVACTDAQGRYHMAIPKGFKTIIQVWVTAPGRAPAQANVQAGRRDRTTADVALGPARGRTRGRCGASRRHITAGETWIHGVVFDAATNRGVSGVQIRTTPASGTTRTGAYGQYALRVSNAPANARTYSVHASKPGRTSGSARISLRRGQKRTADMSNVAARRQPRSRRRPGR